MPSCKKVSVRSRFTPLPGAALAIALATRVYLPSEVQQELELGRPLAVYARLEEGGGGLAFYSLARGCSGYCAGHQSVPAIRSAARTRAGAATSVYVQLQEGVSSFAFYSLARGCSGYCAGHQSVPAIRSAARTRAGAATSGICKVGRGWRWVSVLLPCPGLLWLLRWPPECTCHPKCSKN